MKLKEFNVATAAGFRGGKQSTSKISVNRKGRLTFSSMMCDRLKIKNGDRLSILQDEENPTTWFLEKSEQGFIVRLFGKHSSSLLIQNKNTTDVIFESFKEKSNSILFKVLPEPVTVNKRTLYQLSRIPVI